MTLQEIWYFGVDNVVRSLLADPDHAAAFRQPKNDIPGSLYGSSMCQNVDDALQVCLMHPDSGGYKIGFVFTQIFYFKTQSSGHVPQVLVQQCNMQAMHSTLGVAVEPASSTPLMTNTPCLSFCCCMHIMCTVGANQLQLTCSWLHMDIIGRS